MRLASKAGPPASSARTATATKLVVGPMNRMWPAPSLQTRLAWSAMRAPEMIRAANTAHVR